jgi:hypothetical protein
VREQLANVVEFLVDRDLGVASLLPKLGSVIAQDRRCWRRPAAAAGRLSGIRRFACNRAPMRKLFA